MQCPRCGAAGDPAVFRVRGVVVIALLAAALWASWTILGTALHDMAEGVDRHAIVGPGLLVPVVLLLATALAWTMRVRRPACPRAGCWRGWARGA
jgi:Na+/proline symporter